MLTDDRTLAEAVPARSTGRPLHLVRRGDAMALREHAGRLVRLHAGILWITQEGTARDVVLKPGEAYLVPHEGPVALSAFRAALIEII